MADDGKIEERGICRVGEGGGGNGMCKELNSRSRAMLAQRTRAQHSGQRWGLQTESGSW